MDQLRLELDSAVARCDESVLSAVVGRLQLCMVQVREVGNLKLEVSSQLLDTVSKDSDSATLPPSPPIPPCVLAHLPRLLLA